MKPLCLAFAGMVLVSGSSAEPPSKASGAGDEGGDTERVTLAVKDLEARGIGEDEAATLSDVLRSELMNTGRFQVMERNRMQDVLREQAFHQSGACNEEACLVQMGQLLGIQQLAAGSIGRVGKAYSINARVISVSTGEIVTTVSHHYTGPIEDLLTQEIGVVAKRLAGIEPMMKPRRAARNRTPLILGAVGAGLAAAGGVIGYLVLSNKGEGKEESEVTVTW